MPARLIVLIASLALIAVVAVGLVVSSQPTPSPSAAPASSSPAAPTPAAPATNPPLAAKTKTIQARDIAGAAGEFTFTAKIPDQWQAEAVAATQAISLYDPAAPGGSNLEKSQIFIRHFTANDFLTLSTVTIHAQESLTIAGRPAIRYDIAKKAGLPDFAGQPAWRSTRHVVTDIRVSDQNPSVFYVIARRPDLPAAIYEQFLQSLDVSTPAASLIDPIAEFQSRITKKPFGIYITPENSPVSPERFTGYHTGVDVEYADIASEVAVNAIAPGVVRTSRRASGYGGVVAIEHEMNQRKFAAIYGHLAPNSLPPVGRTVAAGEGIGVLGDHESNATDFERKHLHFAVLKSTSVDLRGYVPTKPELSAWENPALVLPK